MTLAEAYRILKVPRDASFAEVRAAYRRLAAQTHPDRGGDAADFIRVRAAYEVIANAFQRGALGGGAGIPDDWAGEDIPVPAELREVIEQIVADFRSHLIWAEQETATRLDAFEQNMLAYLQRATRSELRQFTATFRNSWEATVGSLFAACNERCDQILQAYEKWYRDSTADLFKDLYRRELWSFYRRPRFWEFFLVCAGVAAALSVAVGWGGPVRRWVSVGLLALGAVLAFLAYRWDCRRRRGARQKVEPLSIVPFQVPGEACFQTEAKLRRGRRTTGGIGLAGLLLGDAVAGGWGVPVAGAAAGLALGGIIDRLLHPTRQMRADMQAEVRRFVRIARSQVTRYVLEAHEQVLAQVRADIVKNYQVRVEGVVKLLAAGESGSGESGSDGSGRASQP
ncbi:MAG: DnaJ domain-containing protein [Thermoleophilia bacterium]|nr:DnaJ domain-containing protein [Thermoleophilia bacterium]